LPYGTGSIAHKPDETWVSRSAKGQTRLRQSWGREARARASDQRVPGRSRAQVSVVAARDHSGRTRDAVLDRVSVGGLVDTLRPHLASDAVLCSDGWRAYAGAAAKLGVRRGIEARGAARGAQRHPLRASSRPLPPPEREQLSRTLEGMDVPLSRSRDQLPPELRGLVPTSRCAREESELQDHAGPGFGGMTTLIAKSATRESVTPPIRSAPSR